MRAEILAIGDELVTGQRLDTNSAWLAQQLLEIGLPVAFHTTVADQREDLLAALRLACERADVVVATGGLGPTADDLTRQALAELAGVPLVQDDAVLAHLQALFARRQRPMPPANVIQAQFPQGSRPIPNPHGTAPGIDLTLPRPGRGAARLFALPGVPAEMKEMWHATVRPALAALLGVRKVIVHFRVQCFGVGESELEAMLPDLIARDRSPRVGITVHQATITLRITAEGEDEAAARAAMQPTLDTIHQCLGDLVFGYEDEQLEDVVVRMLQVRGQTLALAEWGSGGMVAHWLTRADPSGGALRGGMVVGHREGLIAAIPEAAAVADDDEACAVHLAQHVRKTWGADYGLAVGRYPRQAAGAAPTPVALALASAEGVRTLAAPFGGHPQVAPVRVAKQALNLVRLHLLRGPEL
jgi:nicotinamide-nucleotide amidase